MYTELVIGLIITIVGGYFLTFWWHRLGTRIRLQQSQVYLLSKMAEKQGVDSEDIERAIKHSKGYGTLEDTFKS